MQEPSWAAVEAEAEMNYDSRPSLLPDLKKIKAAGEKGAEDDFAQLDPSIQKNPEQRKLWNKLPQVGPYRIMLTNLPKAIDQETLESELSQYNITAKIELKAGARYCYLKFTDRKHCLETVKLYGKRIQGCLVQLKITKSEQQAEIRRANTSRNNARNVSTDQGTGSRFTNLQRRHGGRGETQKHRHPVTGSIRKKRTNRSIGHTPVSNQSSSQSKPANAWGDNAAPKILRSRQSPGGRFGRAQSGPISSPSGPRRMDDDRGLGRPDHRRDERRDFNRRDDRNSFSRDDRNSFSRRDDHRGNNFRRDDRDDRGPIPRRDGDDRNSYNQNRGDRASFRNNRFNDREDDERGNFRSLNKGRKLRDEDGRADDNMNWRNRAKPAVPRKSPRDPTPATKSDKNKIEPRSRMSRGDPARFDSQTSTQQRRTLQRKEQEEKIAANKKKRQNKFAALLEEDD